MIANPNFSFSDSLLYRISQIGRCHIVDFSETSRFYNPAYLYYGGLGQNLRGFIGYYGALGFLSIPFPQVLPRITNNHYTKTCSQSKFYK